MLFACIFLVPELSHAVDEWHNPEGSGASVVQGQAFFSKIISGGGNFYHRLSETAKGEVRTDEDKITVRYQVSILYSMPNMSVTDVSGIDFYTLYIPFYHELKCLETGIARIHPNEAGYECIAPYHRY